LTDFYYNTILSPSTSTAV